MNTVDLIEKKRRGGAHSPAELTQLIGGYLRGSIPDYQVAAWLMAVCFQGMDPQETWHLTQLLAGSGQRFSWPADATYLDKHSTGGVGDTTSLIVVPLVASLGQPMIKLAGRGLGHTGGTVDKLAAIPGLKTRLSYADMHGILQRTGMVMAGQSEELAPADGLLYQLRDVTATVDSLPLIAASIMGKKLAAGAQGLVLDVKTGDGALVREPGRAEVLARLMLDIGKQAGIRCQALLTSMEQPLGHCVGNAVEVEAALRVLAGQDRGRLTQVCVELAAVLLLLGDRTDDLEQGRRLAWQQLARGDALELFLRWVSEQGGELSAKDGLPQLPQAPRERTLRARHAGFVQQVRARTVGQAALLLGAGRRTKEDSIDVSAGIILEVEVGSWVEAGQPLARLRGRETGVLEAAAQELEQAFSFGQSPVSTGPLILATYH